MASLCNRETFLTSCFTTDCLSYWLQSDLSGHLDLSSHLGPFYHFSSDLSIHRFIQQVHVKLGMRASAFVQAYGAMVADIVDTSTQAVSATDDE